MALSNKFGHLLLSTGNKSEMAVGYCTLYGDMNGGLAVIADVPKTRVYSLCRWLNRHGEIIPLNVINKAPSAELKPNQKDQDSLPPYEIFRCYFSTINRFAINPPNKLLPPVLSLKLCRK
jgi:NAD+ synthase (glutamine-hydrolysing)